MPASDTHGPGSGIGTAEGEYAQVFLYRVPKTNHGAFAKTEGELAAVFRRHGVLRSDFYVLAEARIFQGFRDLRAVLEATSEEEVWVEVDKYRNAADSVRAITDIGKDPAAGPLFRQILRLATPGLLCPQGNAERVHA